MIPTTRNVTRVYRTATDAQIASGMSWYEDAFTFCRDTAKQFGMSPESVAGIVAAGSPQVGWGANKANALRWISQGYGDKYLTVMLAKVDAILAGADPLDVLTSDKIRNFYLCMVTNGTHPDAVCIDRHAWDIAVNVRNTGKRSSITPKQYNAAADSYRSAARILKVSPASVQAVTWITWRNRYWADGAFDGIAS